MKITPNDSLLDLTGKVAIVTGGSMGIGYGISQRLVGAGVKVMLAARDQEEIDKAIKDLSSQGGEVAGSSTDVSEEAAVQQLVKETVSRFGQVDILVNNAGIFPFTPLKDMNLEQFEKVIAVNLKGVFLTCKYLSEQMIAQGNGGKIINVTSIDALHPSMVGLAHYDASKHGVWGFTKNIALELAEHKIWVNAVAPGGVMTPGAMAAQAQVSAVSMERNPEPTEMDVPMGRMGVPDDIGKAVLFLASEMSSYMTGSQIVVDGGYLLK